MLIETMTPDEITNEILVDFEIVKKSWSRLAEDYDKVRRRNKIEKHLTFAKTFEIKTKKKNKWIFVFSKAPSEETYKNMGSINICSVVYYYNSIGLRAFKIMPTGGLNVFNGHVFSRYNERMNVGLNKPEEIIKHFFENNGYSTTRIIKKENKEFTISVCSDGLLLGELQEYRSWLVNKTFINKSLQHMDQEKIEEELVTNLENEIVEELNKFEFNKSQYFYKADVLKGISNSKNT
jgi:hypothetical protein